MAEGLKVLILYDGKSEMKNMQNKLLIYKFIVLSILAVFCFFTPIDGENCLIVLFCTLLKTLLNPVTKLVVLVFILWDFLCAIKKKSAKNIGLCCVSLIILLISFGKADNANEAITLAFSICITVFVSGTLTVLITDSGLVEFVAFYLEKIMRKLLNVPGCAAMDIITSFFGSSSVGVFVTNKYYEEKKYTQKEACLIASNFSVVSFGFIYGIISIAKLNNISNYVIGTVIILNLVLGMIMGRIHPISKKSDLLIDGSSRCLKQEEHEGTLIYESLKRGVAKAQDFSVNSIYFTAKRTLTFCHEILIQVLPIYFMSLLIMNYTDVFQYIGKPFEVILGWLQIPEAELIGPSVIIGILEVSLPAVYISELALSTAARFFVAVLSLVQIIFFTETANAILQSEIPMSILDLLKVFAIRTIIAVPILALVVSMLF